MKNLPRWLALLTALLLLAPVRADEDKPDAKLEKFEAAVPDKKADPKEKEPVLSVTEHEITIGGKLIKYRATAGYLVLKDAKDKPRANIFFTADPAKRPLTFSFNGGPGSSSVWLHLGMLGPKRVVMTDKGESLPPPYKWVDNEYSWLDQTDLVFIDPVSTGYSRAANDVEAKQFHGFTGDIESVGEFIRLWTTRNQRWASPKFLVGESYGTTRAAGELPFPFTGRDGKLYPFRQIDTACIKAATKLASPVEYFSRLRSLDAIKNSDVVFLVLDAVDGVTQQDKAIAGEAVKEHKPIVIVVNKWDLILQAFKQQGGFEPYKNERDFREKYEYALFERLYFTPGSPVIFVSAVSGYEVDRMLNAAVKLNRQLDIKLPTAKLNQVLGFLTERMPPPAVGGRRFRIYYATQTGNRPFRIKLFCNREEKLTEQYRRYLEAGLVKEFDLNGCPVYFDLGGKEKHEPGTAYSGKAATAERAEAHTPKWRASESAGDDLPHETIED